MTGFGSWSISSQLQMVFVATVLVLSGIIVLITRLQLDWLESQAASWSEEVLDDQVLKSMKALSRSQASGMTYEFQNYIRAAKSTNEFNRMVFGQRGDLGQPLADSVPFWIEDCDPDLVYYNSSTYNTKYGKLSSDSSGYEVIFNASKLNWVLFDLYKENFLFLYEGFLDKETLNSYPGSFFSGWIDYTPIVREWFHKALNDSEAVIITEPYVDALTGIWIFTVSKAIGMNDDTVIGVSAIDISLKIITKQTNYINQIEGGFIIIATRTGLMISKPNSWNVAESVRIYDESQTGFSLSLWEKIKIAKPGDSFDFTDVNGTNYLMIVDFIKPFNETYITHYVLLFVEKSIMRKPIKDLHNQFSEMKTILFWIVFSVEIFIVALAVVFIYFSSKKAKQQLKSVNQIFIKIKRRAIFPNLTKNVHFDKLEAKKTGIEKLVEACKEKVKKLNEKETNFSYFQWGSTRPQDQNLTSEWTELIYPFNKYQEDSMSWNQVLDQFKTLLKSTDYPS
jgi:hypothetical protein